MATKQKEVTTLDVQIAEFIRNHKQTGVATDDEINDQLVIPFTLDADGIEDLLQRKNCYFLQLYLTGVLHPLDGLQNVPHNACRIRNDPKTIGIL